MPKKGHEQAEFAKLFVFDINLATWKMLLLRAARFTWPNLGPLAKDLNALVGYMCVKSVPWLALPKLKMVKGPKGNI